MNNLKMIRHRKGSLRLLSFAVLLSGVLGLCGTANAGIVVDITEDGGDVVITFSGSFTRPDSASSVTGTVGGAVAGGSGTYPNTIAVRSGGTTEESRTLDVYANGSLTSSPTGIQFWGSTAVTDATFATVMDTPLNNIGSFLFQSFNGGPTVVGIESTYSDGTPIGGAMRFTGASLASLNLTNLGTFVYTFNGTLNQPTVTVNIGSSSAAVPEPASLILLSSIGLAGGYRAYRRKSRRSVGRAASQI